VAHVELKLRFEVLESGRANLTHDSQVYSVHEQRHCLSIWVGGKARHVRRTNELIGQTQLAMVNVHLIPTYPLDPFVAVLLSARKSN
jgi:hypothetical protein